MSAFTKAYQSLINAQRLKPDQAQSLAVRHMDQLCFNIQHHNSWWRRNLLRQPTSLAKSVYLWGGVGRGKTMLMNLFFENLNIKKKRRIHFLEFMQQIHRDLKIMRTQSEDDPVIPLAKQIASQARILCLDEFQVNDIADASIIGRLFKNFFEQGSLLMTTSNLHPDSLYANGLNRNRFLPFIDLLKKQADIINLGSDKDFRREMMSGFERYFIQNQKAFDDSFELLTKGRAVKCQIDIGGRFLTIPKQALGCARFDFDDLCGKPLGANDYLAIAHAFDTIMIDQIPKMPPEKANEAVRFIHLIDTLYDNRVLLIAHAQTNPDQLYRNGKGAREFQRTISRLNEMQSPSYHPHQSPRPH